MKGIRLSSNQFCGGAKLTEKPCIGDEGGPLMGIEERSGQKKLVTAFGILSMTHSTIGSCDRSSWPGVYTKVLDYMPWILNEIKQ